MSGISSLEISVSGLTAAQAGLYVLGHNLGNTETPGYVRQQVIQDDFFSNTIGRQSTGLMQLGLGTDIAEIRQIRDKFLDVSYRTETAKTGFYDVKYNAGIEIEDIIGELESQYKFSSILDDIWNSLNELSINPAGVDARGNFISTAITFIDKVNNVYDRIIECQGNLNKQIIDEVKEINTLVNSINELNHKIASAEASGDNANDYRDSRNLALDKLSSIIRIHYKELPNTEVNIITEDGGELLVNGLVNRVGLRYSSPKCNFVEPVYTTSSKILAYDAENKNAAPLFSFSVNVGSNYNNDYGSLKGLIITRGFAPANYSMYPDNFNTSAPMSADVKKMYFNVTNCMIPKVQIEFDALVNGVVTMINDTLSPYVQDMADPLFGKKAADAPYGLDGSQYTEVFVRKNMPRFDAANNYNIPDASDPYSLYTIGNIMVNPNILNVRDYSKIPVSYSGDIGDQNSLLDLLNKWKTGFITLGVDELMSVNDFYKKFITDSAVEYDEAKKFLDSQTTLITQIDNKRKQISGVSLDEEMKNMLIYQHAYGASAKMLSVIDSMLDKLINGTGRVGL